MPEKGSPVAHGVALTICRVAVHKRPNTAAPPDLQEHVPVAEENRTAITGPLFLVHRLSPRLLLQTRRCRPRQGLRHILIHKRGLLRKRVNQRKM